VALNRRTAHGSIAGARIAARRRSRHRLRAGSPSDRLIRLVRGVGQRTKPTPDVARARPRAPLIREDGGDSAAGGSASAPPSACEQVRNIAFRVSPGSKPSKGDPVRVRNGTPLAVVSNGRVVGTFTNTAISGCVALGFTFDGVITAVRAKTAVAELRGR
jgi:hypothetical protein